MSAPKGNRFWEKRSKHGRDKIFESPEVMWEAACEYFSWCDENPLIEIDFKGQSAKKVELPKMRPYTLHGLCLFLDVNTSYFKNFKAQDRKDGKDFSAVITKIEDVIYNQKFSGAAAGFLNANIIARDLGIKDQIEQSGTVTNLNHNVEMTKEEIQKISEGLEKEV